MGIKYQCTFVLPWVSAMKGVQMDHCYQLLWLFLCSLQSKCSENKVCVQKAVLFSSSLCLVSDESFGKHCLRNPLFTLKSLGDSHLTLSGEAQVGLKALNKLNEVLLSKLNTNKTVIQLFIISSLLHTLSLDHTFWLGWRGQQLLPQPLQRLPVTRLLFKPFPTHFHEKEPSQFKQF